MAATKSSRAAKSARPAKKAVAAPTPVVRATPPREARALMRGARQSPYKMRLVIDEIRGKSVNDALAYLAFSKKHAAVQITKTLKSAVANAEQKARLANESLDVDLLYITHAIVNEGRPLTRLTPAAR